MLAIVVLKSDFVWFRIERTPTFASSHTLSNPYRDANSMFFSAETANKFFIVTIMVWNDFTFHVLAHKSVLRRSKYIKKNVAFECSDTYVIFFAGNYITYFDLVPSG